ncbi:MAG: sulfide-dependent adenosine diphosphate thiazole synthase [Aigarchaeota archaeon]|nr:sulfide-dependent adenosine diphosphate thiazole synthase [Aigarchaeota archaeon]MDW8092502.1 sulfide-dependent adenosine diphosphate thiazole synthase [Nitrososphaerota archaeon]
MSEVFFKGVAEKDITKTIVSKFAEQMVEYAESDVIIVGGGPAGLMAGRDLAMKGVKVLIIEQNNYLGGGFWIGGYLMNPATFRHPAEKILDELGVKYEKVSEGLFVTPAPYACSKLIAAACEAGVRILNMTQLDDVVMKGERVSGVVVNWTPVNALPRQVTCVDPIALESKIVIDASGHDAVVMKRLEERGFVKLPGMGAMWVERSEDAVVEYTGEAYPGVVVAGMAVSEVYGLPRMGPTFGAMLLSGRKAAKIVAQKLKELATTPSLSV